MPEPKEPPIGAIGRDPPDYRYCARIVVIRNKVDSVRGLEEGVRRELQAAYSQGRQDAYAEQWYDL